MDLEEIPGDGTTAENVVQNTKLMPEKKNNTLLKSVFDSSMLSMSLLQAVRDENGVIRDFIIAVVNKQLAIETKRNDLVGKLYTQEYPGILKTGIYEAMLKVMETGETEQVEYYYPYEGFNKWYSCMFVKLDDGLIATNLDIDKRKKAEEQNLKNLLLLQQSEELSKTGTWEYNLHTQEFTWSEGMYKLFHLEAGTQVTPEIYLEHSTAKSLNTANRVVKYIKEGIADFEGVVEIGTKKQSKVIKMKANVFHDDTGQPERVLGVDMDITALEHAEQQIKDDTSFIKGMADAAPDMLYVIDLNKMQMIYANNNILHLFKKSAAEIKNLGPALFDMYVYPKDIAKFYENLETLKSVADEEVKEFVYRLYGADRNLHWIKTRRSVLKRDRLGLPTHVIGVSQDITEQIALQEKNRQLIIERNKIEKQQRQEIFKITLNTQEEERKRIAENLHNGIGQLLYGVKLSLEQITLNSPNEALGILRPLQQTAQLLEDAIFEARRISHELMPTMLEHFGLKVAIEDVCQKTSMYKNIELKCKVVGFPQKVNKHYELAIYRMMQELVLNIIKHSQATLAEVKTKANKKSIVIVAKDNGKGFNTANDTINGIGLKSLKSKVKLLNGKMYINSDYGLGTLIKIQIPNELF